MDDYHIMHDMAFDETEVLLWRLKSHYKKPNLFADPNKLLFNTTKVQHSRLTWTVVFSDKQ